MLFWVGIPCRLRANQVCQLASSRYLGSWTVFGSRRNFPTVAILRQHWQRLLQLVRHGQSRGNNQRRQRNLYVRLFRRSTTGERRGNYIKVAFCFN